MDEVKCANDLIIDLHKKRLDTKKPLWQVHLIYAKNSNKVVLYAKIHHIYGDGITILSWIMKAFSPTKSAEFIPFWAVKQKVETNKALPKNPLKLLMGLSVYFIDVISLLLHNGYRMVKPNRTDNATPFSGQRTVLTGQVTEGRAITTFKLPLPKVLAACKLTRSTMNDFMLTAIDIAVHRFLKDHANQGERFKKPLICQMPVSLRSPGDNSEGNKIAIALVKMAHGRLDPYKRLRQIVNSSFLVKQEVKTYSPVAYTHVSLLSQTGALICELLHLSDKIRPLGNLLVSNVPGPSVPLYFGDCKLNSIFPISTIAPGGGLNITLVTYNNEINVGLLCCNNKLTTLEPLIAYITDSLDLLIESINDPSISIDDLGEKAKKENLTIVEDQVEIKST